MHCNYFDIYISRVLLQISLYSSINKYAKEQLNSALIIILIYICEYAYKLIQIANTKTITVKQIHNSIYTLLEQDLFVNAKSEGEKAVNTYENSLTTNNSKQSDSNIIFPVALVEKFLRGCRTFNVSANSSIYLAAVLEYICADILQSAVIHCKNNNKARINIRDLELSIREDYELDSLFKKLNIRFIGGGVLPYIHPQVLQNKRKLKRKNEHYFTDTININEIVKEQKEYNDLCMSHNTFEKCTRTILNTIKANMKLGQDAIEVLQHYTEQKVINILRHCNNLAMHCNRVKIQKKDYEMIMNVMNDVTILE